MDVVHHDARLLELVKISISVTDFAKHHDVIPNLRSLVGKVFAKKGELRLWIVVNVWRFVAKLWPMV